MTEKTIEVNLLEMITLNEIKLKHHKMALDTADQFISIFMNICKINPDMPVEEIEAQQNQLRAIINDIEQQLRGIAKDKEFVEGILKRNNIEIGDNVEKNV